VPRDRHSAALCALGVALEPQQQRLRLVRRGVHSKVTGDPGWCRGAQLACLARNQDEFWTVKEEILRQNANEKKVNLFLFISMDWSCCSPAPFGRSLLNNAAESRCGC